jgi:hypothetical protein
MTNPHRAVARRLSRDLAGTLRRVNKRDRFRALGRDWDLITALDLAFTLVAALDFTLGRARDLDLDLDHALSLIVTLDRLRELDRGDAHMHGPDLDHALLRAHELEGLLAHASAAASSGGPSHVPMRLAWRLTAFAAGFLPSVERARYGEEFGSELVEIALAGGGCRAQLVYGARTVLSSAWQLRAALRSPRRRGAVQ